MQNNTLIGSKKKVYWLAITKDILRSYTYADRIYN